MNVLNIRNNTKIKITSKQEDSTLKILNHLVLTLIISLSLGMFGSSAFAGEFSDKTKELTKKEGLFDLFGNNKTSAMLLAVEKTNQPFIYVTSLMQGIGSNNIGLDRGQIGESRLVQFERYGDKLILRQLNPYFRANSENPSERAALTQAFAESILYSFSIVAVDGEKLLIDVSDFTKQDFHGVAGAIKRTQQGSFSVDDSRSVINWEHSKAFPNNTELSAVVTFKGKPEGRYLSSVTPDARYVSIKFRHSFIALPDDDYEARRFHPYSGYFPFEYQDYSQPIDKPLAQKYITRHRLTLNKQGQVTKPITYYLDPGVPEPVRGALLDGARWWSDAFNSAGLKGGFEVKMLPADADPLDVRYNVIQWVHRSTRGWSYGSSVTDPRTGEILKGHVTLGSLRVRQDYLIASGLLAGQDKQIAKSQAQEMALARIRQLSAHEVGHTLGIAHNFAASAHDRASVMDYPHPLALLKNNKVDLSQAYGVGAGEWDNYVVKYGYGNLTPEALTTLISDTKKRGLKFISDREARSAAGSNPWAHLWDSGEKADQELIRLMAVRNTALSNMNTAILSPSQAHSDLREAIVPIYLLHRFQVTAAAKIVAGVDFNYALSTESLLNEPVDVKWQLQALKSILKTLSADYLALPKELLSQLPATSYGSSTSRESMGSQLGHQFDPLSLSEASARHSLVTLLHPARMNRLVLQNVLDSDQLSLEQLFDELVDTTIKSNIKMKKHDLKWLVSQRTNAVVIEQLLALLHNKNLSIEARQSLGNKLATLTTWLTKQSKKKATRNKTHVSWLALMLTSGIDDVDFKVISTPAKLPPGSPI